MQIVCGEADGRLSFSRCISFVSTIIYNLLAASEAGGALIICNHFAMR
ncbi:MAG: hypothetical protein RMK18_07735 [Armatimonadota bacterium]|nr:hypothetical protein [Armatimonadota bacterium]MDW8025734.1 hypothetical protein [Armatimonadota bacterium]